MTQFSEQLLQIDQYISQLFTDLIEYATTGTRPDTLEPMYVETYEQELEKTKRLSEHLFDTVSDIFGKDVQNIFDEFTAILRTINSTRKQISNIFKLDENLLEEYLRNFGFDKYPLLYVENKRRLLDSIGRFYKQKGTITSINYLISLLNILFAKVYEYKLYLDEHDDVKFVLHRQHSDSMDVLRTRGFDEVTLGDPTWHIDESTTRQQLQDLKIHGLVDTPYFAIFILSDYAELGKQVKLFYALFISLLRRDLVVYNNGSAQDIDKIRNIVVELLDDKPSVSLYELVCGLAFTYRYRWTYQYSDPDLPICSDSTSLCYDSTSYIGYGYYYDFFQNGNYDSTMFSSSLEVALAEIENPETRLSATHKSIVEQILDQYVQYSNPVFDDPTQRLGTAVAERDYAINMKSAIFTSIYDGDLNFSYRPFSKLTSRNSEFATQLKTALDSAHANYTKKEFIEITYNRLVAILIQYFVSRYQKYEFIPTPLVAACLDRTIREMVDYIKPVHAKLEELGVLLEIKEYPEEQVATSDTYHQVIVHKFMERLPDCILYDRGKHFDDWLFELPYNHDCCSDWTGIPPTIQQWYFDDCIKEYVAITVIDSTNAMLRYDTGSRYDTDKVYDFNFQFIEWWRTTHGWG